MIYNDAAITVRNSKILNCYSVIIHQDTTMKVSKDIKNEALYIVEKFYDCNWQFKYLMTSAQTKNNILPVINLEVYTAKYLDHSFDVRTK